MALPMNCREKTNTAPLQKQSMDHQASAQNREQFKFKFAPSLSSSQALAYTYREWRKGP